MSTSRRSRIWHRSVVAVAWFLIRWVSWLLIGHPIGLSLFATTAVLKMPLVFALVVSLVAEVLVGFLASRLSTPAAVALSWWRRFCRRRRQAGSLRSAVDGGGVGGSPLQLGPGWRPVGGRTGTRISGAEVRPADRHRLRRPGRFTGWTVDLSCGAVSQETDSKVKQLNEPRSGARVIEDVESSDRRSRSHSWTLSVGISSRRGHGHDDYVVNRSLDDGESATLAERLDGSGAGMWREGGGA